MTDAARNGNAPPDDPEPYARRLRVLRVDRFARVQEHVPEPLLGTARDQVFAAGGDVLTYGDGGSGKTTMKVDFVAHAAAGVDWLGIEIPSPIRVLVIENEGPRAMFRDKLDRKLDSWQGPDWHERVHVLEEPWARFTLDDAGLRDELRGMIADLEIDLLVAGPLAEIGGPGPGTPDEITAFDQLVNELRHGLTRPLAVDLIHHTNKGGDVSGAWRRWPDTLIRVRAEGKHRTLLTWEKVRHSSRYHGARMTLAWSIDTEGFELVDTDTTEAAAIERAAKVDDALDWILAHVDTSPGEARGTVEKAYAAAHGGHGRALAREAIDTAISAWIHSSPLAGENRKNDDHPASTRMLATGPGRAPNGTYLYPASTHSSPLAAPLFGEHGEQPHEPAERECSPLAAPPKGDGGATASSEQADPDPEPKVILR